MFAVEQREDACGVLRHGSLGWGLGKNVEARFGLSTDNLSKARPAKQQANTVLQSFSVGILIVRKV
jgi:hypothetical protein